MNIAFNTAVSGMMAAQSHAGDAAREVVNNAAKGQDIIQASVAVKKAEAAHAASAMTARIASDMAETLLDISV